MECGDVPDIPNTHKSESLIRPVAKLCQNTEELGIKRKLGVLASMQTREAFEYS